jgi:hypothetical protein
MVIQQGAAADHGAGHNTDNEFDGGSSGPCHVLRQRYYHRDLCRMVENPNCDFCQRNKLDGKGCGFLPEREVRSIPFEECAMDLIGPWTVQACGKPYKFEALTVIDTVANLVELGRLERMDSDHVMQKFAQYEHIIRGHNIVYMILEENSQDKNSKPYYRTVTSGMCALHLMPCAKECTRR